MGRTGPAFANLAVALLLLHTPAAADELRGRLHTEAPVEHVRVQVWPAGEAALDRNPLDPPFLEARVAVGSPFALPLPENAALPIRVEVDAPGHVGACLDVVLPEQLATKPLWLPRGEPLEIVVTEGGESVEGARVWGALAAWPTIYPEVGRWGPCLPAVRTDAAGRAAAWTPGPRASGTLFALSAKGRWGTSLFKGAGPDLSIEIASHLVAIAVRDPDDRPVAGARVADAAAPPGLGALTDPGGAASIQALTGGEWQVAAVSAELTARRSLGGPPGGPVSLVARPGRKLRLESAGAPLVATTGWLPPALVARPAVAENGRMALPWLGFGGLLAATVPGSPGVSFRVATPRVPLAVPMEPAARVSGTVTDADERTLAGVPVWLEEPPAFFRTYRIDAGGAASLERRPLPAAVTDERGRFAIPDLPAMPVRVVATLEGRPPAASEVLELAPGAARSVSLVLEEGLGVDLRVVTEGGEPLPGALVSGWQAEGRTGDQLRFNRSFVARFEPPLAEAGADEHGHARLGGLPAGRIAVRVRLAGFAAAWRDATLGETDLDLGEVVLTPGVDIDGRVLDEAGDPVAEAAVQVAAQAGLLGGGAGDATSGPDGRFVVADLPRQGEIWLEARGEGLVPAASVRVALPPEGPVELRVERARSLGGRVVDAETAEPIPDAHVHSTPQRQWSQRGGGVAGGPLSWGEATTDENGEFLVEGLEPAVLEVTAVAEGWRSLTVEVTVPRHDQARPVTLPLERGLEIRGRVVDASESPVPGVPVRYWPADGRGSSGNRFDGMPLTGPDGEFVIAGLGSGDHQLEVRSDQGGRVRRSVRAGADDVVLRLEPPGALTVLVVDPDRAPVPGSEVAVRTAGNERSTATTDSRGIARLEGLAQGSCHVSATAEGWATGTAESRVEPGAATEVTVTLSPAGVIVGRVVGLDPETLGRVDVRSRGARAAVGPDGAFRLEGVPLGRVEVAAHVYADGRQRRRVVEVADPDRPVEVEIDFAAGITLEGRATRAGRPEALARVVAGPPGGRAGNGATTDQDGRFGISGLDPGVLEVEVRDRQGVPLTVERVTADADAWVEIEVPEGTLAGLVTSSETRRAVPGASVGLRSADLPLVEREGRGDSEGRFRFEGLADGRWTVRAEAAGFAPAQRTVTLSGGSAPDVALELEPEEALGLVVRDLDGSIPDQVSVTATPAGGGAAEAAWAPCDEDGRARITNLGRGSWTLLVRARGAALLQVEVPSEGVPVALGPTARVELLPPSGDPPGSWRARFLACGSGLPLPLSSWWSPAGDGWLTVDPAGSRLSVPAGTWTVEAVGPDRRPYRHDLQARPDEIATLRLE